jgi:hypothetical protein
MTDRGLDVNHVTKGDAVVAVLIVVFLAALGIIAGGAKRSRDARMSNLQLIVGKIDRDYPVQPVAKLVAEANRH